MARVTFLIISIACLIIAGVCSGSLKSGRRDVIDGGLGTESCMLAKNADHDTDDESTMSDERHDLTCSNHWFVLSLSIFTTGGLVIFSEV